jgi:integrase
VEAENFLVTVDVSKLTGSFVDPRLGKITLAAWVEQWRPTTVDLRESSRARDESYLRTHVLPTFGKVPLARITPLAVRQWVAEMVASGKAAATVRLAAGVLSKVLRGAVEAGLIASNPVRGVPLPKIERDEVRFLAPEEIAKLADAIDARYRAWVLVGAYGGLRFGELAGLRRSRVDLVRGTAQVSEIVTEVRGHHVWGPPKTKTGRRTVPLPRFVVDALDEHLRSYGQRRGPNEDPVAYAKRVGDDLVFPAPEGGPLRASLFRRRYFAPAVQAAGLGDVTPHGLRHTAVALWIAAGAYPLEVAKRAGHTSVVTVLNVYGHLLPKDEDRITAALDAMGRAESRPRVASVTPIEGAHAPRNLRVR